MHTQSTDSPRKTLLGEAPVLLVPQTTPVGVATEYGRLEPLDRIIPGGVALWSKKGTPYQLDEVNPFPMDANGRGMVSLVSMW